LPPLSVGALGSDKQKKKKKKKEHTLSPAIFPRQKYPG
jgi:hypothetical protein